MGLLYPETLDLAQIEDSTERHVVDILLRRLSDDWFIIPNFRFRSEMIDREIDVILVHLRIGVAILEVKGGQVSIQRGQWTNNGNRATPDEQALKNSFALREFLSDTIPEMSFKVAWGVALPKISEVRGELPAVMNRGQLLLSPDFDDVERSVETLFDSLHTRYCLDIHQLERILNKLCPDAEFVYDPHAESRRIREQLAVICEAQVQALMSLDSHHRVLVTGRAGTGKTYLAIRWAQSGLVTGEEEQSKSVLFTCYNDPLGLALKEYFPAPDEQNGPDEEEYSRIVVGPFFRTMLQLKGLPALPFENTEDSDFWDVRAPSFLVKNWHLIEERFDRIIVDEAQDFSPAWIGLLESLLDPAGDNKMFLLSDPRQRLIDRGFVEPSIEAGWVHAELVTNVRNSREIARLARRFLDGAAAPSTLPTSTQVSGLIVESDQELIEAVKQRLGRALRDGIGPSEILVVASDSHTRDLLRTELALGRAERQGDGLIPCETAHRAKGLEASLAIAAIGEHGIDDGELYVAITRAITELHIIGPKDTLQQLGLI
jgi:hypothetical protein